MNRIRDLQYEDLDVIQRLQDEVYFKITVSKPEALAGGGGAIAGRDDGCAWFICTARGLDYKIVGFTNPKILQVGLYVLETCTEQEHIQQLYNSIIQPVILVNRLSKMREYFQSIGIQVQIDRI